MFKMHMKRAMKELVLETTPKKKQETLYFEYPGNDPYFIITDELADRYLKDLPELGIKKVILNKSYSHTLGVSVRFYDKPTLLPESDAYFNMAHESVLKFLEGFQIPLTLIGVVDSRETIYKSRGQNLFVNIFKHLKYKVGSKNLKVEVSLDPVYYNTEKFSPNFTIKLFSLGVKTFKDSFSFFTNVANGKSQLLQKYNEEGELKTFVDGLIAQMGSTTTVERKKRDTVGGDSIPDYLAYHALKRTAPAFNKFMPSLLGSLFFSDSSYKVDDHFSIGHELLITREGSSAFRFKADFSPDYNHLYLTFKHRNLSYTLDIDGTAPEIIKLFRVRPTTFSDTIEFLKRQILSNSKVLEVIKSFKEDIGKSDSISRLPPFLDNRNPKIKDDMIELVRANLGRSFTIHLGDKFPYEFSDHAVTTRGFMSSNSIYESFRKIEEASGKRMPSARSIRDLYDVVSYEASGEQVVHIPADPSKVVEESTFEVTYYHKGVLLDEGRRYTFSCKTTQNGKNHYMSELITSDLVFNGKKIQLTSDWHQKYNPLSVFYGEYINQRFYKYNIPDSMGELVNPDHLRVRPEPIPEPIPEPVIEYITKPEPVIEYISKPEPVSKPIPVSKAKPEPVSKPIPVSKAKPVPVSKAKPVPVPKPVPVSKAKPKITPLELEFEKAVSTLNADFDLTHLDPKDAIYVISELKPITNKMLGTAPVSTSKDILPITYVKKLIAKFKELDQYFDLGNLEPSEIKIVMESLKPILDKLPITFKNKRAFFRH